jgi:signal transduction histidine kinase/sensor domain CHASE-containing protein
MHGPIGGRSTSWRSVVPKLNGLAVAAIGALLLAGVGAGRIGVPLTGTLLGFIGVGLALAMEARGHRGIAAALALAVLVGAVATLWHHERLLPRMGSAPAHSGAGSAIWPATSTAVAGGLAALALLVGAASPATATILGIGVLALGVLGLTGRMLELHSTFVGTMPWVSALGATLLGSGLVLRVGSPPTPGSDLAARYTPYAAGATCLLATVLFWQSLVAHQRGELQRVVEMTAVGSLAELGAFTTSVTRALTHIAEEWNAAGRLPAAQWRYQSRLVLERLGGPRTVEWIDDEFDVLYVVHPGRSALGRAATANEPAPPVDDPGRTALLAARASLAPVATPAFAAEPDRAAFRLAVPLLRRGEPDGFVSALFEIDEMLDDLLAMRIHDYVITVFEGDRQIYGPRATAGPTCSWCRPYTLDLPGGRSWELRVQPSAELRETIETSFPQMILWSGILISILLTAMLQLLARERRGARDLARANRALHDEVISRRTAEDEIRTLATELEQRVRDRTRELATSNTALRNENALRQRTQATLETANQNLRHFASFVSHELRQPLATMALWSELLETSREVGLNDKGRGYLKQVRAAIDRMTGFLEAQLRLARVTYTQPTLEEDVDVAALIREVVGDGTLGLAASGATVEIGDLPTVHADSAQLRQLFRNLLENAVKYRRPGTPLVVHIHGQIATRDRTRYCEIRVSDNGQGFAEHDAEKIFDLFEQLPGRKSAGAGSGVGLAICRRIVEHHGGTIRAEGTPGSGATFIVELPFERCEGRDPDHDLEVIHA